MASQSVPPRELFTANVARKRRMLLTELFVPLRSLEMPNNFVLPFKCLITNLAYVRWNLTLSSEVRDLSVGRDDR